MPLHSRKPRLCIRTIQTRSLHLLRHKESRNASWRFRAARRIPSDFWGGNLTLGNTEVFEKYIKKSISKKQHTFLFQLGKKGNTKKTSHFFWRGETWGGWTVGVISRSCSASFLPWNFDPSRLTRDNYLVVFCQPVWKICASQSGNHLPKYRGKKHQVRL